MVNYDFVAVLRMLVKSAERKLILVHTLLREITVIPDLWFFDIDKKLPRPTHLEDIARVNNRS